ncbi:TetR/AcrR family transcriptional regulator [Litorivivens sp.]|uniref:TetR/AcrR family transcriptional regulator n=1 Tax=Litorivivens sp. TaxID=2020868 RepID=UPI00356377F1
MVSSKLVKGNKDASRVDWELILKAGPKADIPLRVIEAAAGNFAERGIEDTSVQQIIERAGVARRSFYRYFPDKLAVMDAMLDRSLQHLLVVSKAEMFSVGCGLDRLRKAFDVYLRFARTDGRLVALLSGESQRPDSPLMMTRLRRIEELESLYIEAFEQAEGRTLDRLLARSLILLLETLTLHVLTHGDELGISLDQVASQLHRFLDNMIAEEL